MDLFAWYGLIWKPETTNYSAKRVVIKNLSKLLILDHILTNLLSGCEQLTKREIY